MESKAGERSEIISLWDREALEHALAKANDGNTDRGPVLKVRESCHDPFPELSPMSPPQLSSGFTPLSPPRVPQATLIGSYHTRPGPMGLSESHLKSQPKPWSECTSMALGMLMPFEIM